MLEIAQFSGGGSRCPSFEQLHAKCRAFEGSPGAAEVLGILRIQGMLSVPWATDMRL